ncbi:hemolysin family protein [Bacillus sp. NPDC077027]|uniref:hemolysin family protein n=1 Tax=Bacillus sp. NPDC077027 TaxID=3390548 RepID=UPI003D076B8A
MDDIVNLSIVGVLIALTAFFVASEFAIVKVRSSKIDQLIAEGSKKAIMAKKVTARLDEYLSACQLGITVTSLGLGWIGKPAVKEILVRFFGLTNIPDSAISLISATLAFAIITFLHVVVGELAPKTLAIQKAERMTLWLSGPLHAFYIIMYPFIYILNGSARILTKMIGLDMNSEKDSSHSEEELKILLSESLKNGEINPSEYNYMNKIFDFDNRIAREIMIPRREICAIPDDMPLSDILAIMTSEKYTRFPVFSGDKDTVIGMLNKKHLFADIVYQDEKDRINIKDYIHPVIEVIDTIPIQELLVKMQRDRMHLAILTDEYGGTSGLVTTEDILEEIVGDIRDEFDEDEQPIIQKRAENHYVLDGKVRLTEINELIDLSYDDEEIDTIGGLILKENIDIQEGQSIFIGDVRMKVLEMDGRYIKQIDLEKGISRVDKGSLAELDMKEPLLVNEMTLSEK